MKENNPLIALEQLGQSIWIDFISRQMIESGKLRYHIENDGVSGITSNPSIFQKAIAETHEYDEEIHELAEQGKSAEEIYEILTIRDIQNAADLLHPVFEKSHGLDGYVSLEVSPKLAHDTDATMIEARRLWETVNRLNLMIKIPGTKAGLPAIRQLTNEGININVTLLFGLPRYEEVMESFVAGLEDRHERNLPLFHIASVASFFLSRIDVLLDPLLEHEDQRVRSQRGNPTDLKGQIAISSAKIAYEHFRYVFQGKRFLKLAAAGAHPQRLLWASTSTKNPAYSDVKYVEPLIGAQTINTLPLETLEAYRHHGKPYLSLSDGNAEALFMLERLKQSGIDLDAITSQLEKEGIEKFVHAYEFLMNALHHKMNEFTVKGAA